MSSLICITNLQHHIELVKFSGDGSNLLFESYTKALESAFYSMRLFSLNLILPSKGLCLTGTPMNDNGLIILIMFPVLNRRV